MIKPVRLREMMSARELSQSELARRVGVTQATVYRLLSGKAYGSTSLHRIARELGTTPAYLTGETDDPDEDAPPEPELTHDERDLLDRHRAMRPADRKAVLQLVTTIAGRATEQDLGDPPPLPPQHALEAMFAALLSVCQDLDDEGRAFALAKHLPRALAQAADVDADPATARTPPAEQAPRQARRARRT